MPVSFTASDRGYWKGWKNGLGSTFGDSYIDTSDAGLDSLHAQGYDHIRRTIRATVTYPGQGAPPIITRDFTDVVAETNRIIKHGLGVIWATEVTAQEDTALLTAIRTTGDATRFDQYMTDVANAAKQISPAHLWLEIFPEPGWCFRDTPSLGLGNLVAQRLWGTQQLQLWQTHAVPIVRAIAPKHTLLLGTPGYGAPYGPGVFQDITVGLFTNVIYNLHDYWPHRFTHDNQGYNFPTWPIPNWRDYVPDQDENTVNFEADNMTWDQAGLNAHFQKIVDWQRTNPCRMHIAEWGSVYKRTEQSRLDYDAAYLATARKYGFETMCKWVG